MTKIRRSVGRLSKAALTVAIAAGMLPMLASPASAQEYAKVARVSYPMKDGFGRSHPTCRGHAFIGQTYGNSVEAYSTLTCDEPGVLAMAATETRIGHESTVLESIASHVERCTECGYVIASVSTPGGPSGTRFCVLGFGNFASPVTGTGSGTACITT